MACGFFPTFQTKLSYLFLLTLSTQFKLIDPKYTINLLMLKINGEIQQLSAIAEHLFTTNYDEM